MKKTLLLIALTMTYCTLYSQTLKSEKLRAGQWKKNTMLTIASADGKQQIQLAAKGKKIKKTPKKVKPLVINGDTCQLIQTAGVIHILGTDGSTLLQTNKNRKAVFGPFDRTYSRETKRSKREIRYLDNEGNVILFGKLRRRIIEINAYEDSPFLIALCMEELIQKAQEDYNDATDTSLMNINND